MRHKDLATGHTMAEVAVTAMEKFMVIIHKVTDWSHCLWQAEKWQSLQPFFSLVAHYSPVEDV